MKSVTDVLLQFGALSALKGQPCTVKFLTIREKCYLCSAIRHLRFKVLYNRKFDETGTALVFQQRYIASLIEIAFCIVHTLPAIVAQSLFAADRSTF